MFLNLTQHTVISLFLNKQLYLQNYFILFWHGMLHIWCSISSHVWLCLAMFDTIENIVQCHSIFFQPFDVMQRLRIQVSFCFFMKFLPIFDDSFISAVSKIWKKYQIRFLNIMFQFFKFPTLIYTKNSAATSLRCQLSTSCFYFWKFFLQNSQTLNGRHKANFWDKYDYKISIQMHSQRLSVY